MTADREKQIRNIETCRDLNRRAAKRYRKHGVEPLDIAIAAVFSAYDLATVAGHSPFAAIEWLRSCVDIQERQLFEKLGRPN